MNKSFLEYLKNKLSEIEKIGNYSSIQKEIVNFINDIDRIKKNEYIDNITELYKYLNELNLNFSIKILPQSIDIILYANNFLTSNFQFVDKIENEKELINNVLAFINHNKLNFWEKLDKEFKKILTIFPNTLINEEKLEKIYKLIKEELEKK